MDGKPRSGWVEVESGVRCFLDLNFIRSGKDPVWTPETGRRSDRSGVLFVLGDLVVSSGMRVRMTRGPSGTFLIEGALDEVWRPTDKHHVEIGVVEVPSQITKGQGNK